MKPASYTPPALWPATTAPEDVPAQVVELGDTAIVYHVAGFTHENLLRTCERLERRGLRIVRTDNPRHLIVPLVRPLTRRAA